MSGSAISSAKRRRANNVLTSPLFQSPESQQNQSVSQDKSNVEEIMSNRPLTLQQALQLLNGRIVQLERDAKIHLYPPHRHIQLTNREFKRL